MAEHDQVAITLQRRSERLEAEAVELRRLLTAERTAAVTLQRNADQADELLFCVLNELPVDCLARLTADLAATAHAYLHARRLRARPLDAAHQPFPGA
jgi:hypothetical protein